MRERAAERAERSGAFRPLERCHRGPRPHVADEVLEPPVEANLRHIMPAPAGNGTGDSWANAASLWRLNDMIAAAGPGGTVYVRADAGPYSLASNKVNISVGGKVGSPVTIIGVTAKV